MRSGLLDLGPLRRGSGFRRLWAGGLLSALAGQVSLVALLQLVWDLTGSAALMGTLGLAHAVPMVVLGLYGGALADAYDRRRVALATTAGSAVVAALLATQAAYGLRSLALVLVLVACQAGLGALGAPARRALIARVLAPSDVPAGVALSHVGFQVSMLVGPAVGGLLVAYAGAAVAFGVQAALVGVAWLVTHGLPPTPPTPSAVPARSGRRADVSVLDGLRAVARSAVLRGAMLSDVLATVLVMPVALFPVVVAARFDDDPAVTGLMLSAVGAGGILAGLASGVVSRGRRPGRTMVAAALVWCLGVAAFGASPWLVPALLALAVAGAADTFAVIARGVLTQLATTDDQRGRVSSVEHVVGVAGPDLGNARGGAVAGFSSPEVALVSGGLLGALGVAAVAFTHPAVGAFSRDEVDARPAARRRRGRR
ncbi:MFS transporter [Mumia quercus]|uniref:MFS transporter n=1 Tax=Mumia quercus TaxID=2976125 RepID=UPI0021CFD772|nr:MFS transporter [Mumia quercus]